MKGSENCYNYYIFKKKINKQYIEMYTLSIYYDYDILKFKLMIYLYVLYKSKC